MNPTNWIEPQELSWFAPLILGALWFCLYVIADALNCPNSGTVKKDTPQTDDK